MWLWYRPVGTLACRLRCRPKNLTSSNHCLRPAMTSFKGTKCTYIKSSQWGSVTVRCHCRSGLFLGSVLVSVELGFFLPRFGLLPLPDLLPGFAAFFVPSYWVEETEEKNNFLFWIETNFRPPYPTPQTTHKPGNHNVSPSHGPDEWECETISRKFLYTIFSTVL